MFRRTVKWLISQILTWEARLLLGKYRPKIVAITGSVGKTTTKEAVYLVLQKFFRTRRSEKSYNNEWGVPLTILGCASAGSNLLGWIENIIHGASLLLLPADYPEWLVLELGIDRPGDIARLMKWLPVDVAVIARLPDRPVHLEYFPSVAALRQEKLSLIRAVGSSGAVILNADDEVVLAGAKGATGTVITYGFLPGATVRGTHERLNNRGYAMRIQEGGHNLPLRLPHLIGQHQLYAVLAAAAVAVALKLNLLLAIEAVSVLEAPPGRGRLIAGIKDSQIIDDSYNSSPAALEAALKTMTGLPASGRRIAVIGDMLELGAETIEAHREAGRNVAKSADWLITVGVRAKFIAAEAERCGLPGSKIRSFDEAVVTGQFLQTLISAGDLVLVKGSQALRLERVVEEIMAEPERRKELLVRQETEWQPKK